ncbi:TetR/AcrR family transcriptional regulator [Actinoplanes sp. NPDC051343]|uniref:TetR/AcrR family transcriptional regulator n=1 Tax=Actinoplanes sp. NPDC051343 TaxID=3363906 RepID=UPI003791D1D4
MRSDGQANRDRILSVAEDVFGRGGPAASTEEVARRAGVGIATVFRHFPTKAALLEAVLIRRFDRLCARAEGAGFYDFFRFLVADAPTKIAIGDAFEEAGGGLDGPAAEASRRLRQAVGALLAEAQEAGTVRRDVALPEVYALLVATSRTGGDAGVRDRVLTIVSDGLAP